jgi:CRISPR/Cas system-associated exonuclease Cas4 (RecB family)
MVFPDSVRVHQIVDYWYCCERSRLMACEGLECPKSHRMDEGFEIHEWLENRPKTGEELKLYEALKPYEPFSRAYEGVQILAHPDDLAIVGKNKVQIVEYKTVDKSNVKPWKTVLAKYQTQLYGWVLQPILEGLGYQLAHTHKVVFLSRNGLFLKRFNVECDNYCVERMVREVFNFWKTGAPLIKPMKWKCQQCPSIFKSQCRFCQANLEVSYHE